MPHCSRCNVFVNTASTAWTCPNGCDAREIERMIAERKAKAKATPVPVITITPGAAVRVNLTDADGIVLDTFTVTPTEQAQERYSDNIKLAHGLRDYIEMRFEVPGDD